MFVNVYICILTRRPSMPYFYRNDGGDNDINLLFIHIPKTGGSSFENYMSKRYSIPLNQKSLFGHGKKGGITFQHWTLRDIIKNKNFSIHQEGLRIIAFVRNPYDRAISELFWAKLINKDSTPDEVYTALYDYLNQPEKYQYDNHNLPQYEFIIDDNGSINPSVEIAHLETLQNDLMNMGFTDFDIRVRVNEAKKKDSSMEYSNYMNKETIKLINDVYDSDFKLFGYTKIISDEGFATMETEKPWIGFFLMMGLIILLLYFFGKKIRRFLR